MKRGLKPVVFLAACAPLALIVADLVRGAMVDPVAQSLNRLGFWTLTLLCVALACTPAKIVLGWTWPNRVRRMLGLFAFTYASLHFATYLVIDQGLDFAAVWEDVAKRKFITIGFASFLILVPLAVTSTDRMVKRLGFKRWKALHRLGYLAAAGGVVHFLWRVKADPTQPLIFGAVLSALLLVRLGAWLARRRAQVALR